MKYSERRLNDFNVQDYSRPSSVMAIIVSPATTSSGHVTLSTAIPPGVRGQEGQNDGKEGRWPPNSTH